MAYLIFTANGEEYDRREISGGVTIGRAPDCDIGIHDIILSRHHCRIEPNGDGWIVTDLHSKNGTFLHGRRIERNAIKDGSELQVGRTRLTFKLGALIPSAKPPRPRGAPPRAADPNEALAGTVSGMVVCEPGEVEHQTNFPRPQPRPRDPSAYNSDGVQTMINEIISSSWDSIMAQNSQPIRMQRAIPVPGITKTQRGDVRPKPRVSFCLQAELREASRDEPAAAPPPRRGLRHWRWVMVAAVGIAIACWAAVALHAWSNRFPEVTNAAPQNADVTRSSAGVDLASYSLVGN